MKACDRDMSISLIRGIAMLMVITCHLCEQLSQGMSGWEADFFLRFGNYCANGVQIFLFISGYLYAGKDRYFELQGERITFLGESFAKILFPYYVYSFLVILPVYARLQPDALTVRSVAGLLLTSETVKGVHHLWFIPYILMCYVLTPALYDIRTYIRKKGISALKVVLLLCIGTEVYCYFFSSFFIPEWICVYGIGYFWRDLCCEVRKKGGTAFFVLFGAMLISNVFRYLARYIMEEPLANWLGGEAVTLLCNWSQVLFALALFTILHRQIKIGHVGEKVIAFSDKYSYTIYLAHMIYIKGPLDTLNLTNCRVVNLGITLALVFASGVGLLYLCQGIRFVFANGKARD